MISKIAIKITLWDERGEEELGKAWEWFDITSILYDRRAIHEEICAITWPMLNKALDAARDVWNNLPVEDINL